jgi:hypothetical protein
MSTLTSRRYDGLTDGIFRRSGGCANPFGNSLFPEYGAATVKQLLRNRVVRWRAPHRPAAKDLVVRFE